MTTRPSNQSTVKPGDKLTCSVEDDVSSADNYKYTWLDSATGDVLYHGADWTINTCPHQSCSISDDELMNSNCVNYSDGGLLMLECHVTVAMTTAHAAVVLYVNQSEQICGGSSIATTQNS